MSLVKLLTEYPQYSARRVRRLAVQIALLETFASKEVKGIVEDLMEFNLLQAKLESQLNDDVKIEGALQRGTELHEQAEKLVQGRITERICVTPLDQALRLVTMIQELGGVEDDDGSEHLREANRARGILTGSSFFTDKTIIRENGDEMPPLVHSTHSG